MTSLMLFLAIIIIHPCISLRRAQGKHSVLVKHMVLQVQHWDYEVINGDAWLQRRMCLSVSGARVLLCLRMLECLCVCVYMRTFSRLRRSLRECL